MEELKKGDVVTLKSGSMLMTVRDIRGDEVDVDYFISQPSLKDGVDTMFGQLETTITFYTWQLNKTNIGL